MMAPDGYLQGGDVLGRASAGAAARNWLVPILISVYLVPIPGFGTKLLPLLMLIYLLMDSRVRLKAGNLMLFGAGMATVFLLMILEPGKMNFLIGLLLVIMISHLTEVAGRPWDLRKALWLHMAAAIFSAFSLIGLGYDMVPEILYGESRHAVHNNSFLTFRASGLYQEPSTMGLHMLLLSIWADRSHPDRKWIGLTFSGIALLTFSSITILAAFKIAIDLRHTLRSKSALLLVPVILVGGYFALQSFYGFFLDKLILYNSNGFENAKRFEALFFTLDQIAVGRFNFFTGHPPETIQRFVLYDLGPLISTSLILGLSGVILMLVFLARMRPTILNFAIILSTKAAIGNPLLWVATSSHPAPSADTTTRPPE